MIDLEDALAGIVEVSPEPPDVSTVTRRARQRRARRRGALVVAAVVVVVIGIGSAIALRPTDDGKRVILRQPKTESVRVTLLDGSQLEISGPESLGLTKLEPSFSAALDLPAAYNLPYSFGHSFHVERRAPEKPGAVVGRYPTKDGHELVVHTTENWVVAIVQYDQWALVVGWNHDRTNWPAFAQALNAHESADGYLVIEPVSPWILGPTDSPDVQLGGEAYAEFSFFAPWTYPSGCPTAAETVKRTAQGWPVSIVNGAWWCDADAHVRVHVSNRDLIDEATDGLRVDYSKTP